MQPSHEFSQVIWHSVQGLKPQLTERKRKALFLPQRAQKAFTACFLVLPNQAPSHVTKLGCLCQNHKIYIGIVVAYRGSSI